MSSRLTKVKDCVQAFHPVLLVFQIVLTVLSWLVTHNAIHYTAGNAKGLLTSSAAVSFIILLPFFIDLVQSVNNVVIGILALLVAGVLGFYIYALYEIYEAANDNSDFRSSWSDFDDIENYKLAKKPKRGIVTVYLVISTLISVISLVALVKHTGFDQTVLKFFNQQLAKYKQSKAPKNQ